MKFLTKPNQWSCLATSFAMALGITTEEFYTIAFHDGSEIIFPLLPEPQRRRGFHISEACLVALQLGFSATPIEWAPMIAPSRETEPKLYPVTYGSRAMDDNSIFFNALIARRTGVIECRTQQGNWHAVAFDCGNIYDPDGREFHYSQKNCLERGLYTTRLWSIQKHSR